MTTYRIADRRRWTSVSNGLIEDGSISFRARGLLVWLLSKPDGWSVRSDAIAASSTEGRDAVRTALRELEAAGYIKREKARDEAGRWVTFSNIYETPEPGNPAPDSRPSVSQALSTKDGEASTEQQSSSLRSEEDSTPEHRVAKEYWEWFTAENDGLKPTIDFLPLRAVAKRLLKSGNQHDEIVDAMKTARAWTAKALADEIARKRALAEERTTTVAIPHSIVRAFGKAKPFFSRHAVISWPLERDLMVRCASLMARGFGIGETMIRLALALRVDDWNQWSLANVDCPRFDGELDDYADAMERAWVNRRWSVR